MTAKLVLKDSFSSYFIKIDHLSFSLNYIISNIKIRFINDFICVLL